MHCSISGEIPQEPVISKRSGHLFEKRLILKYIEEEGKCPVTGEPLEKDDLISVNANKSVRPRPLQSNSIPGLLTLFQNEWDELMLETYTLKQHLDTTRQELSQALYQHDAACRVIAKLMKERDEARAMLNALQTQGVNMSTASEENPPTSNGSDVMPRKSDDMEIVHSSDSKLDEQTLNRIMEKFTELSKGRKGRKVPSDLATRDAISGYHESEIWSPHDSSKAGITSMKTVQNVFDHELVSLTGGVDKSAILTDLKSGRVISKLAGHAKKVNCVTATSNARPLVITGSADRLVKVWQPTGDSSAVRFSEHLTFAKHENEVTGVAIHPTDSLVVSVSRDATWCLNDLSRGVCHIQKSVDGNSDGYTCCQFHPDGLILATGTESGLVRLWDIREQQNVANCEGHTANIHSLSFNENGYMLATGGADGLAHVWDLRKIKSLTNFAAHQNTPVTAVSFDHSGNYLASGGEDGSISVCVIKEWTPIMQFKQHENSVTGLAWGDKASSLISSSLDRTIKVRRMNS